MLILASIRKVIAMAFPQRGTSEKLKLMELNVISFKVTLLLFNEYYHCVGG